MEITERYEVITKLSESVFTRITLSIGLILLTLVLLIFISIILDNIKKLNDTKKNKIFKISSTIIAIPITTLLLTMIFKPTLLDNTITTSYTEINKNVDTNKYKLEKTNNKEYLIFDNKGNDNIYLKTNNTGIIKNNIFKILDETDDYYILEVDIDNGLFSQDIKTEKLTLKKPKQ